MSTAYLSFPVISVSFVGAFKRDRRDCAVVSVIIEQLVVLSSIPSSSHVIDFKSDIHSFPV